MMLHVTRRLPAALLLAVFAIAASNALHAAERGPGGMRQQPLNPGRGLRSPHLPAAHDRLRSEATSITFRGTRYLVSGGHWYEQRGDDLVPITPPAGVLVEELPAGHTMRWVGGVPYFYAGGLYYLWRERVHRYEVLPSAPAADTAGHADSARESTPAP